MNNLSLSPEFRLEVAAAAFDKNAALHVLRVAWWLEPNDPLTAQVMAEAALNSAAVGYMLGAFTLATATRIRLFAEALGARKPCENTPVY